MADKIKRGRDYYSNRTHCDKGHPLSGDNLYISPSTGARSCKICMAEYRAAYRKANKEKIAARNAAYYQANKKEIAARDAAYYKRKKKETLNAL